MSCGRRSVKGRQYAALARAEQAIGDAQNALVLAVGVLDESGGSPAMAERLDSWKVVLDMPRADLHRVVASLRSELEHGP